MRAVPGREISGRGTNEQNQYRCTLRGRTGRAQSQDRGAPAISKPNAIAFRDAGFPDWGKSEVPSVGAPRADRYPNPLQQEDRDGHHGSRATLECRPGAALQAGFPSGGQRNSSQCYSGPVFRSRRQKIKSNSNKGGEINSTLQTDILFGNCAAGLATRAL